MLPNLTDQITGSMAGVKANYNRLVLVVGSSRSGKTAALRLVRDSVSAPLINVNLELSRRLLELTERQRSLQIPRLLDEIIEETGQDEVLLDNTEILFDIQLRQDPLKLLQGLSRNRTIVAAWNGRSNTEWLFYATPDHPEFRQYPLRDLAVVSAIDVNQPGLSKEPTE